MTRSLVAGLFAGMLLLTACNDPNKNHSAMTTDDTNYPSGKSETSSTYTPSSTTPTTYPPVYTTTTSTPPASDTTSYSSNQPSSYNTTATSPPVTTVITPANSSNTEMSGDESLSPSKGSRSKTRSSGGGSGQTYTVKAGDSLSKISKQVYGDAGKWNKIYNANKSKISNPNKLKVGTKLTIP
jgi:nucleoid-associated protein YgaU